MQLFFRDDDFGQAPEAFARLAELFRIYEQRLNVAAIPALATEFPSSPLLEFVVHGFAHQNYSKGAKKSEFCSERTLAEVRTELLEGKRRIAESGAAFFPAFVPPWNRIAPEFLPLLKECGYLLLSRSEHQGATASIPELNVVFDLHTSAQHQGKSGRELFKEMAALASERTHLGVMLHHGKMKEEDFLVLEQLLRELEKRAIAADFFSDFFPEHARPREEKLGHV